jgi:hypothetical protein
LDKSAWRSKAVAKRPRAGSPNNLLQQTAAHSSVFRGILPSRPPLLSYVVRRLRYIMVPMKDELRSLLLDLLAIRMAKSTWPAWLKTLFPSKRECPEGIYAFEFPGCDEHSGQCKGTPTSAWLVDSDGMKEAAISPDDVPKKRCGFGQMWYCFPSFSFFIDPTGHWVVLASVDGPRAGVGGRYRVVRNGDAISLVPDGAIWKA